MARRGGRPKKDPFAEVPQDFRDAMMSADDATINAKIAEVAKNNAALQDAKEKDDDLKSKKAAATTAGAVYREGAKACKQKITYLRMILEGRGKPAGESGLPETPAQAA